ncbi:MAG TPA: hypothetical protein VJT49_18855 [Amycolatopsis sp.]|uniref:hypothetical protein n=1 Tax=Amycolatopsis sp. TaxID=37632 RepID=UPI002B45E1D4|nr:hypothetical protein [Amycolatopsis sp.]HKS47126.1 hypothetical protein [Amycolatopsis sp.]
MTDYAEKTAPAGRILRLADQLADELEHFETQPLCAADIRRLLNGMSGTAAALTRILDELRSCPAMAHADNDLGLPTHRSVLSQLAQAAAAAEDLKVTAAALCRQLPREVSTVDSVTPAPR